MDLQPFFNLQLDDPKSMDKIYEAWWGRLFDLAFRKTGDTDISTEIVQEVLISLWENRHKITIEKSLGAYLLTAVKYRVLNYYKSNLIRQEHQEHLTRLADYASEHQAENMLLVKETQNEIDRAVQELPERMQVVFTMSKMWGKTNQEIADELNISVQTVKNQLSSALKILRKTLSYL